LPDKFPVLSRCVRVVLIGVLGLLAASAVPAQPSTTTTQPLNPPRPPAPNVRPPSRISPELLKTWLAPAEPLHIAGPIYSVGTQGLCVYLVTTPAGDILIGGGMPASAGAILDAVRKLGRDPAQIKLLLSNHGHIDHAGTLAELKAKTGAQVLAMAADVPLLAEGGRCDYLFANSPDFHFPPVKVDRTLSDGEQIELGGVVINALLTPGHTPGCATFTMTVEEQGRTLSVVFADGLSVNNGTRFLRNPSYPGILADYRRTFETLLALKPDIFLAFHAEHCDFAGKRARAAQLGTAAFVDPEGYARFVARKQREFETLVARESQ
jgi:metallo-beta-lactamase class B